MGGTGEFHDLNGVIFFTLRNEEYKTRELKSEEVAYFQSDQFWNTVGSLSKKKIESLENIQKMSAEFVSVWPDHGKEKREQFDCVFLTQRMEIAKLHMLFTAYVRQESRIGIPSKSPVISVSGTINLK